MRELLMLLCQYPYREKSGRSLSALLNAVEDWHQLVRLINSHGIISLAAYNIREAGLVKLVPEESMAIIENGYRQSLIRNLWLTEKWKEVNLILSKAGIKHILLKGMALEHTLYESKGLRQMNDNDILIKKEDAFRAWELLQESGFKTGLIKSLLYKKILPEIDNHMPALYKDGYTVELHMRLFGNEEENNFLGNKVFSCADEILIDNEKAFILRKDIHLKYLVKHFERHLEQGACQLRSYADIILLDNSTKLEFPGHFIMNPFQDKSLQMHREEYRSKVNSVLLKYKFLYIIGDLFPNLKWMQKRYNCNGFKALLHYPQRLGKLVWLI